MLRDLGNLRTEYSSDVHNIAADFYNPCLGYANSYDRITGFFSSSIFNLTHAALGSFIRENHGKMRILCSPRLSGSDAEHLLFGYVARDDATLVQELRTELSKMLASSHADSSRLLAALIAAGRLDVKLARVADTVSHSQKRMFHDKVGLFKDSEGDIVGFRGSLNESYLGLSPEGNIESVDVWPSWEGGRDEERVRNAVIRFDLLWEGRVPGVAIAALPDEIRMELEQVADHADLDQLLDNLASNQQHGKAMPPSVGGIELKEHQKLAVKKWEANQHHGIFAHATGAGKTITGLYCAQLALQHGLVPVVLVPSKLLLDQWKTQVHQLLGARVVLVGGGHNEWSKGSLLRAAAEAGGTDRPYVIIAVLNSALNPAFKAQLRPLMNKLFVIVDEAHRLGSTNFQTLTEWMVSPWRLGLSATPERANDPEGTRVIFEYFRRIVHRYSLKDALDDHVLAPYVYRPSWVGLTDEEQQKWDNLTAEIRRLYAMARGQSADSNLSEQLLHKLIERSRIAKGAERKIERAADLVSKYYRSDGNHRWLIYCDNRGQVDRVRQALARKSITSWEYHRQMQGNPEATLQLFDVTGGIVVAIKCLDEGVDIPAATHALILASSRNPREFIQRRGRVLRRASSKTVATVLDVLVLPEAVQRDDPSWPLVVGELARAMEFAEWDIGRASVSQLEDKWVSMGLSLAELDQLRAAGIEADGEDEMTDVMEGDNE